MSKFLNGSVDGGFRTRLVQSSTKRRDNGYEIFHSTTLGFDLNVS